MRRFLEFSLAMLALFSLPGTGWAQCDASGTGDICADGSAWFEFTRISVQPLDPSMPATTLTLHGPHDLTLDVPRATGNEPSGRILVVGGRAMLMRDVEHEAGHAIDALDGAVLMTQVVVTLLDQAFPAGPESVRDVHPVQVDQKSRGIRVATPSASGRFEAPWGLTGTVRRQADRVEYDLRFMARAAGEPFSYVARGFWQKESKPTPLDESMSLDGWTVHWLGPMTTSVAGATALDYGAAPTETQWKDLGGLRKWIAEEPARRASRRTPVDASNPGPRQSITYQASVTGKDGVVRSIGAGVREYTAGTDVLAEPTERQAVSKTLSLGYGLSILVDVYRKPTLEGFGLVLVSDASPCFSWEWFDRDGANVFKKLQGGGLVKVSTAISTNAEELMAVEFLDDIVLDCQDQSSGSVYDVRVRKGSVLRLRP